MGRSKGDEISADDGAPPEAPTIYQFPMGEATLTTTESALLGACILSPEALALAKGLDPEDMYRPHHRALLRLLRRFAQSGKPWDLTLLAEHLSGDPAELEACGGSLAAISGYADEIPSPNLVPAYVEAIQDAATRRRARTLGSQISQDLAAAAADRRIDMATAVEKARHRLATLLPGHTLSVESVQPETDVWRQLSLTKQLKPKASFPNLTAILTDDSRWKDLRLNKLGGNIEKAGQPQDEEAKFLGDTARWIARYYEVDAPIQTLQTAIQAAAQARAYHPVQEYLTGLEWDGQERIAHVLPEILGVASTPLYQAYIRRFLIGAVARAMRPGVKFDTALIFVGLQGAFKSTFFKTLFGSSWFGDSPIPIGDKDAFIQLRTVWCYESAEMEDLSRKTAEAIKQFLSGSTDVYRAPYDREAHHHPRHSVMVGTTNKAEFLTDDTGHRRFWPITIPDKAEINIALTASWRDQIWAEALTAFRADEPFWLSREDNATLERDADIAQYQETEPWAVTVENVLRGNFGPLQTADVMLLMKLPLSDQHVGNQRKVAGILRKLGWEQHYEEFPREGDPRKRIWRR